MDGFAAVGRDPANAARRSMRRDMAARLVLSLDGEIVREVELTRAVTVVGRHPDCDIVVEHPAISGRHMLLRLVDRTVYVEDLASTNGTKVNGVATGHQVVHHLDVIEIGRHRIHFFDDALLAGAIGSLESTVLTDYERTMLAAHATLAPAAPAPVAAGARDEDLSRTMAIPREAGGRADAHPSAEVLALRVLAGERAGEVLALERANTMIGTVGADTALLVRRGGGYFLARLAGRRALRLNRRDLAPGAHPVGPGDVIDVGDSRFEVIRAVP